MKKSKITILSLLLLITTISFASAEIELSELLAQFDQDVVLLVIIFLISFAFLFFALKKTIFQSDPGTAGVISAMLSFLIMYGVNKSGIDMLNVEGMLGDVGISSGAFALMWFILVIAGIVFLLIKFAKNSFIIIGGLLILLGLFAYEKALLITLGAILIAVRIFIKKGVWEPPQHKPKYQVNFK